LRRVVAEPQVSVSRDALVLQIDGLITGTKTAEGVVDWLLTSDAIKGEVTLIVLTFLRKQTVHTELTRMQRENLLDGLKQWVNISAL